MRPRRTTRRYVWLEGEKRRCAYEQLTIDAFIFSSCIKNALDVPHQHCPKLNFYSLDFDEHNSLGRLIITRMNKYYRKVEKIAARCFRREEMIYFFDAWIPSGWKEGDWCFSPCVISDKASSLAIDEWGLTLHYLVSIQMLLSNDYLQTSLAAVVEKKAKSKMLN